jgi:amino acid transporter
MSTTHGARTEALSDDSGQLGAASTAGELARGSLGAAHIIFMVLAAAAPMAVVVAIMPIAIALGDGAGTPGMFLLAGLVLLIFSVGYVHAVPYVRNAGAFYAYIARGLGRPVGLVAAYLAMVGYNSLSAATCGALAFFASGTADDLLGISLSWPVWAAIFIAIIAFLSFRRITVTARLLGIALIAEVTIVLILNVAILGEQGPGSFSLDVFSPGTVFAGSVGVAIMYAVSSFLGFEGTAIYAEEAKDSVRTVRRATYAAVAIVGIFYVFCAWALIATVGTDQAQEAAGADPGNFLFNTTDEFLGGGAVDVISVLVVTSSFAAVLAFHNAAARYFYALARDGFLPRALGRTHPRYQSPYVAGMTQIAILSIIVFGFAIGGLDPLLNLATAMTGFGAVALMSLLAATSLAVAVFFYRRGEVTAAKVLAPIVAAVLLAIATVIALANYPSLTGSTSGFINSLPWFHLLVIALGLGVAFRVRATDPKRYAAMGATRVD